MFNFRAIEILTNLSGPNPSEAAKEVLQSSEGEQIKNAIESA